MRIVLLCFGRICLLVFRALWGRPGVELVHVNEAAGDAHTAAHLLAFDSVHGRWSQAVQANTRGFFVGITPVSTSQEKDPTAVPWREAGVQMVLECSGKFKTPETLQPYFDRVGLKRVVVACPVKGEIAGAEALNVVFGINHHLYNPNVHRLITAASCTTNGLAPVVKVVHERFGIRHGSITTLHDVTNGHAVRVPLLNASLTDAVFELERTVTVEEVNRAFDEAANGELEGILGYETRPLVSVDYVNDPRSAIVDGPSTMVVNGTQLKVYAWYDNEWGYSSRMADLACHVALIDAR
ncbi:MAG: glyceraldehyde 3-phosphate dehydrogenase NAD-binding domain-containing protein [Cyanobium sp.]